MANCDLLRNVNLKIINANNDCLFKDILKLSTQIDIFLFSPFIQKNNVNLVKYKIKIVFRDLILSNKYTFFIFLSLFFNF